MAESQKTYESVKAYIDKTIFHSEAFDKLEKDKKVKAVTNAEKLLYLMYKQYKPEDNPLPVEAIAYQTVWILEQDDAIRKMQMGLASQSIEGMTQSFAQKDVTISPIVKRILKKRVGSYNLMATDTHRGLYRR